VENLRKSEERFRVLHESLRDAFVQVTMDGHIVECNDIFYQMLGYTPEEMHRLTYRQITPARWHAFEADLVRDQIIPRGYSDVYEKEYQRRDGKIFPVELRTILSRDAAGQPIAMWAIVRDITERKQAEDNLRQLKEELENRVVARTNELNLELLERRRAEEALELEKQNLRHLTAQLITAQEEERGRLSRDLHDDFGQSLLVLSMQINAILKRDALEPATREHLEKAVSYLAEVTNKVRRFSQDLSPPALERLGLAETLRELAKNFRNTVTTAC
jgi:PAS domain S-box-containing protein